jgi:hypothetical protein
MNWTPAEKIAAAVLYEGYLLYPYRASALKNRKRGGFGAVPPGESTGLECLLEATGTARLAMKLKFLQEVSDSIEEREVLVENVLAGGGRGFSFPPLDGTIEAGANPAGEGIWKVGVRVENRSRADVSLLSAHALLGTEGGAFVSMFDPPDRFRSAAATCERRGLWPMLVGAPPDRSLLLAAPILLSDYPAVAPESPRDLFDGTEIDEILSLRILTLSEAEKDEIRHGDARARQLLERTERLSARELLALHGVRRPSVKAGDRVRLRPNRRADILDLALEGREATVVAIEEDLEGRRFVAVTVAADPGRDLGQAGFPGHRFFFTADEVELL